MVHISITGSKQYAVGVWQSGIERIQFIKPPWVLVPFAKKARACRETKPSQYIIFYY